MTALLRTSDPGFSERFRRLMADRTGANAEIARRAKAIIDEVRENGDSALAELTRKLDQVRVTPQTFRISRNEIQQSAESVSESCLDALRLAARRIERFHAMQLPNDRMQRSEDGSLIGWRWNAIDTAGIYVPGGTAAYPSSVLMNAIPAKVAGVRRIVMVVPTPNGNINPQVLAAARIAGLDEIYRIGGAQAIAALAYGTETIPRVDTLAGPGNAFVAAAKKLVFGDVGIDSVAGPSEVTIIADHSVDPSWIASDLLAQAEHDSDAQAILLTDSENIGAETITQIDRQLPAMDRQEIASASWHRYGAVIVTQSIDQAVKLANRIAPEHLQLLLSDASVHLENVRNAGAVFVGRWTPEAIGDYIAGPNHVLPTMGTARFASGLSVLNFLKRTTILELNRTEFVELARPAEILAKSEGLFGHARSLQNRRSALEVLGDG